MTLPQFSRIDDGVPSVMTRQEMRPYAYEVAVRSLELCKAAITTPRSPDSVTEIGMDNNTLVLLNEDYLIGYTVGDEWLSLDTHIAETFIHRVGTGPTTLRDVMDTLRAIAKLEGATCVYISTLAIANKVAGRRLYQRAGLTEMQTTMRLT